MSTFAPAAGDRWAAWPATNTAATAAHGWTAPSRTSLPTLPAAGSDAFFDLDNTLVRGASVFHLARGLHRRGAFTTRDIAAFAVKQARFRSGGEDLGEIACATNRALAFVRGIRQAEMIAAGEQIYDEVLAHKLWHGSVALARRHLDAGARVWLVTAAPDELATLVARRLGLTGGVGTRAEVTDGVYTGRLVDAPLHGPAKAAAVRELAAREGVDLTRSAAYSDSANDLPLLTAVGRPCAVNPDRRLAEHAERNGWPQQDFRPVRRAARMGVPAAAGLGVAFAGVQLVRHRTH
jgi:HAD superfamily hydrolase (TIGR01490 family)